MPFKARHLTLTHALDRGLLIFTCPPPSEPSYHCAWLTSMTCKVTGEVRVTRMVQLGMCLCGRSISTSRNSSSLPLPYIHLHHDTMVKGHYQGQQEQTSPSSMPIRLDGRLAEFGAAAARDCFDCTPSASATARAPGMPRHPQRFAEEGRLTPSLPARRECRS